MLTENFVASTLSPSKHSQTSHFKDLGVHLREYQPNPSLKHSFKRSSAQPNCLAVSASHIFAAQSEKAVVHVYSRDQGNQEAIIPFPERIRSMAYAGTPEQDASILVLGTEAGALVLWELATGRTVTTPPAHLQATTHIAVSPNDNHILSGSSDSTLLLWSLPTLLSFEYASYTDGRSQYSPLKTLSAHRAAITALIFGHSPSKTNIAISASKDQNLLLWDPVRGDVLHTFFLSSPALCLALDPVDRACYVGYDDGSIQLIDFYKSAGVTQMIRDPASQSLPTQLPAEERWRLPSNDEGQDVLCLDTSYDGTTLLSGHKDGKIHAWDVGRGRYGTLLAEHDHAVTNLIMLPPTGFPNPKVQHLKLRQVVKPKYESSFGGDAEGRRGAGVPPNYAFTAQFMTNLPLSARHERAEQGFQDALMNPEFPEQWLEEGIAELDAYTSSQQHKPGFSQVDGNNNASPDNNGDGGASQETDNKLQTENEVLKGQLAEALARHRETINRNTWLEKEQWRHREEARIKGERKKRRRLRRLALAEQARKKVMGEKIDGESDEEMDEGEEELSSSSTDEITDTD